MTRRVPVGLFALVVTVITAVTVGCNRTGANKPAGANSRADSITTAQIPAGRVGCAPASPIISNGSNGPEVTGTGEQASLYGLLMPTAPMPLRVGQDLKVVWRMTGSGPLKLSAISPDGKAVALVWGPEAHDGSNYDRPGDEWGAGYRFTRPGCWHLHAQRTTGSADVWLEIKTK